MRPRSPGGTWQRLPAPGQRLGSAWERLGTHGSAWGRMGVSRGLLLQRIRAACAGAHFLAMENSLRIRGCQPRVFFEWILANISLHGLLWNPLPKFQKFAG